MNFFGKLTDGLMPQTARAAHRQFLEAAMAGAALVAGAEGPASFAKRHALDRALESVDALKSVDVHISINIFNDFIDDLRDRPEQGHGRALKALGAVAGDREFAEQVLRICVAIARADGDPSAAVLERVRRLSAALGIASPDFGDEMLRDAAAAGRRPFVITLGNKKGGTGKSTTAIHLVVALLKHGYRVGSIDLDGGQGTLSHYLANRRAAAEAGGGSIVMPEHRRIEPSQAAGRDAAEREERGRLRQALADLAACDFVVVDTPGSDSYLSRLGHANADLLITPLNDSFLDLDVLAEIDRDRREVLAPSAYCRMVWEQRDRRAAHGGGLDWIVMRNRLAHIDARNNREIADLLTLLSKRIGFRMEHGLSERVVFRELFFKGLTLLDLPEDDADARNSSRRHARREVSDLVQALGVLKPAAG